MREQQNLVMIWIILDTLRESKPSRLVYGELDNFVAGRGKVKATYIKRIKTTTIIDER